MTYRIMLRFNEFLKLAYEQRREKNQSLSLRSFARHLRVSPAALSEMLRGKRAITSKMRERIGLKLGLSLAEIEALACDGQKMPKAYRNITKETFAVISDSSHYALLELMGTKGFKWDARWIAARLGITVTETRRTIANLERTGLLKKTETGFEDTSGGVTTDITPDLTSEAQRRYQEQLLTKAALALKDIPLELRDNTSVTFKIKLSDIPLAKEKIKNFRRELAELLDAQEGTEEVYHLNVNLIPATVLEKES